MCIRTQWHACILACHSAMACALRTGYGHFRCCCKALCPESISKKYAGIFVWPRHFIIKRQPKMYCILKVQRALAMDYMWLCMFVLNDSKRFTVGQHVVNGCQLACLLALQFHKFHFAFAKNCMHLSLAFAYTNTRKRCLEVQFRWQPPVNNQMPNKTLSSVNNSEARRRDSSLKKEKKYRGKEFEWQRRKGKETTSFEL